MALTAYNDPATPGLILQHYRSFTDTEKAAAIALLRPAPVTRPCFSTPSNTASFHPATFQPTSCGNSRDCGPSHRRPRGEDLGLGQGNLGTEKTADRAIQSHAQLGCAPVGQSRRRPGGIRKDLCDLPSPFRRRRQDRPRADRLPTCQSRLHPRKHRGPECDRPEGSSE